MKKIRLSKGTNIYDFFIVPTIRIDTSSGVDTHITVEWLKWYIGIAIDRNN
jgi:hypothetical protein